MKSLVSDGSGSMSQTESPLPPKLETKCDEYGKIIDLSQAWSHL
ncbi:hypothetical protein PLAN_70088 [Planktothrix rubescens CCAP 1459/22]|uniref:Uncharacterized protein n=1 Tax=Planktothrix rubescens CCAP 1459/22 TaxID=329571 RepID=A0A6J7ZSB9_PLARU|nr:hypothetical protein PLAN_70088 [Planktothrix rubescens NIVA-CYA 18]CAD0230701.1 hypothetical protein PL10110_550039 [Planktothrix agardhii]